MTKEQKLKITALREAGYSYCDIANEIELSEGTVKSYCRRNGLMGKVKSAEEQDVRHCLFCGKEVRQNPGRKEKKFCSDTCRSKWWNKHLGEVNRKSMRTYKCAYCHKPFKAYESAGRKYCCHECYIEDRFGGDYRD